MVKLFKKYFLNIFAKNINTVRKRIDTKFVFDELKSIK